MIDIYVSDNWDNKLEDLLESLEEDPERERFLEKLADAFFDHLQRDDVEFGGWGVDSKRPFGNSFVEGDIAEILEIELPEYESEEYDEVLQFLAGLYADLGVFLRYKWLQFRVSK